MLDNSGFNLGSKLLYNTGCMSTSAGPRQGISKAIALSYSWLVYEVPMRKPCSWMQAWTPMDVDHVTENRIPILMHLAKGVDVHFWVRFESLQSADKDKNFRLAWRALNWITSSCLIPASILLLMLFALIGCNWQRLPEL